VPEDVDWQSTVLLGRIVILPTNYFKSSSHSNEVDEKVKSEVRCPNQQALFERVVRKIGELISTIYALLNRLIFRKVSLDGGLH